MRNQLFDLLDQQTTRVRSEIEELQTRLDFISGQLDQHSTEEESISRKLREVSSGQRSFQKRVDEIAEKLNYVKSILASVHS